MILVTGATGQLGTAVINQLLTKMAPERLIGFVHDRRKASALEAKGVGVRAGDYDDPASLLAAMRGVEKVLLISGNNEQKGLQQHRNVVEAAKASGVRTIAYTGRSLRDPAHLANTLMKRHFETEDAIRESGLEHLLFRNALYMDTLPLFVGAKVFESGIRLAVGSGRTAFTLRSELGEAMANALADHDSGNRLYKLTGPETWSFGDVASTLSALSGKEVRYTPIEPSAFTAAMKERGVPEAQIEKLLAFQLDIKNGQESEVAVDLETLLGREPASLEAGLKTLFNL